MNYQDYITEYQIWGNSLATWGISFLFILGAIFIVKLLSLLGRKVIIPFIRQTDNRWDNAIYYSLHAPIKLAVMLVGIWIAIHRLVYPDSFVKVIDNAYRILIVLNITWFFVRLAENLLDNYSPNNREIHRMMPLIRRGLFVVIWSVGIIMALSNVGVNIGALLGTLGIGGIAFALAAQDTIKNIFSAFTIFTDKPFSIGDTIRLDNFEGTVIDVGARSTRIMDYDKRVITLPNHRVVDASIVNISSEPARRITVTISIDSNTTAKRISRALEMLRDIPLLVNGLSNKTEDASANFSSYTESALIITCYFFVKKGGDILKVTSDMNIAILSTLNKARLELANPTHILYVHQEHSERFNKEQEHIFSETSF